MCSQLPPRPPDYDIDSDAPFNVGERLFESPLYPKQQLTGVEESTAEWKFVEKLLPKELVPEPPKHANYPAPSGWMPPTGNTETMIVSLSKTLCWSVGRETDRQTDGRTDGINF